MRRKWRTNHTIRIWVRATAVFVLLSLTGVSLAQIMTTEYQEIAQVSMSDVAQSLVVTNDDWAASIGESTMTKSIVVSNALFYTLSNGTHVTAQISSINGESLDQLQPHALDAIASLSVAVEKGDNSGSGDSSGELWNDIAGTSEAEGVAGSAVVVEELFGNDAHGRSSDSDIGIGQGADVTFSLTIDVEDGPTFPSTTLEILFTALSSE